MNPIEFISNPPYSYLETAVEKIQELSAHPWGNSVTLDNIEKLFEAHLDHIISQAMKLESARSAILEPLKRWPSLLCARFGESGKDVAFRVLGGVLSLEPANSTLPVLQKDVLQKIFSEMVRENYRTIRQVSRLWKECADNAWKDSIREQWVAPGSVDVMSTETIYGIQQMFSVAKRLDLATMEQSEIPALLHLYPELQGLKLPRLGDHLEIFCPKLSELMILEHPTLILQNYNLRVLKHLKSFECRGDVVIANFCFPPSIEKVILADCSLVNFDFHETTRLKELEFFNCSDVRMDLASPPYQTVESLNMASGRTHLTLNWPLSMDHLSDLYLGSIAAATGLNFSGVAFPQLKNLLIMGTPEAPLPPARFVPNLEFLALGETPVEDRLSLEWYSKLKYLMLYQLTLESVTLPESMERIAIGECIHLRHLALPVDPIRLKKVELNNVSLEEIDLSRYTGLKSIEINSYVECHLILGEHSPEPTVSENVHVTYGSKKKQRIKGEEHEYDYVS